jgi:hypothetical protein
MREFMERTLAPFAAKDATGFNGEEQRSETQVLRPLRFAPVAQDDGILEKLGNRRFQPRNPGAV